MREYSLSNLNPIVREIIISFMIFDKMSVAENLYFFKNELFIFSTGIPYGFMGKLKIFDKTDDGELFLEYLKNKYANYILDEDSFPGKFLKRIERYIKNEETINPLELIVPEAYPPRFFRS